MTEDDILHQIERHFRERRERVRQVILAQGRPDIVAEFDRDMKNLDSGITGARNCWNSISSAQRRVLQVMGQGRCLRRTIRNPNRFDACGRGVVLDVCRLATARKLCAHELIHVNGGATDPEAEFVMTERGKFVLRWGPIND